MWKLPGRLIHRKASSNAAGQAGPTDVRGLIAMPAIWPTAAILIGVALIVGACSTTGVSTPKTVESVYVPTDVRVEQGRRYAERICARCHAIGAEGASPNAAAPPFPVLASRYDIV